MSTMNMNIAMILEQLESHAGVRPSDHWLQDCCTALSNNTGNNNNNNADAVLQQILHHDLRDVIRTFRPPDEQQSVPDMPPFDSNNNNTNNNNSNVVTFASPPVCAVWLRRAVQTSKNASHACRCCILPRTFRLLVQVEEFLDTSVNATTRLQYGPANANTSPTAVGNQNARCLKLYISDGYCPHTGLSYYNQQESSSRSGIENTPPTLQNQNQQHQQHDREEYLVAMETSPVISQLSVNSRAGLKVLLHGPMQVRHGVLLWHAGNATVLGGNVASLVQVQLQALEQAKLVAGVGVDATIRALIGTGASQQLDGQNDENDEAEEGEEESRDVPVAPPPPPPQFTNNARTAATVAAAVTPMMPPPPPTNHHRSNIIATSSSASSATTRPPFAPSTAGASSSSTRATTSTSSTSNNNLNPYSRSNVQNTSSANGGSSSTSNTSMNPYAASSSSASRATTTTPSSSSSNRTGTNNNLHGTSSSSSSSAMMSSSMAAMNMTSTNTTSNNPYGNGRPMQQQQQQQLQQSASNPYSSNGPASSAAQSSSNRSMQSSVAVVPPPALPAAPAPAGNAMTLSFDELRNLLLRIIQNEALYEKYHGRTIVVTAMQQVKNGARVFFDICDTQQRFFYKKFKRDKKDKKKNNKDHAYVLISKFHGPDANDQDDGANANSTSVITCKVASAIQEPFFGMTPSVARKMSRGDDAPRTKELIRVRGAHLAQQLLLQPVSYECTLWHSPQEFFHPNNDDDNNSGGADGQPPTVVEAPPPPPRVLDGILPILEIRRLVL